MENVDEFKQKLLELRAIYSKRKDDIHKDTHHLDEPVEKDFAEQVVQRENDDVLDALEEESKQMISKIDNALLRIKSGDYGVCKRCGEDIPEQRLRIVPFAEYCVKCADEVSKT